MSRPGKGCDHLIGTGANHANNRLRAGGVDYNACGIMIVEDLAFEWTLH